MKDYVEVNEEKCGEVHNCMCAKEKDGKMTLPWVRQCHCGTY